MISRRIARTGIVFCAIFHPIAEADSTTYNERLHYLEWVQKFYETADSVFLGEVVAEETPDPPTRTVPNSGNAATMSELLEMIQSAQQNKSPSDRLQNATFNIDKTWKGTVGPTIRVTTRLYSDDTGLYPAFSIGESYLIFAYKGDDGNILHVPVGCASHQSADETSSKIRVLDALIKKPGTR